MPTVTELMAEGRHDEAWEKYCGFLDLTIEGFMQIQRRLLLEQIQLLTGCELGRTLLKGQKPTSVEEFRAAAPITTYVDYLRFLSDKSDEPLPAKAFVWMRTSGRTGDYGGKWVPCPRTLYTQIGRYMVATIVLASARHKGDIRLTPGDAFLYTVAPPPYVSGTAIRAGSEEFPLTFVPSIPEAEAMGFQERVEEGFLRSLETGIDYFMGLASVLLRIGEAFAGGSDGGSMLRRDLLKPRTIYRLGRALLVSKLQRRQLLPKDIWTPKGVVVSGMDVQVYKRRIEALWGITPLEAYACTEFGTIALQAWGAKSQGLTLVPDAAFWEFMPEAEYRIWQDDRTYRPATLLLDEVTLGRYVLVGTSFAGGAFVRYFLGDMIAVIALSDEVLGIELPQIVMESRADDIIDLASLVWLSERALWQAIGEMGSPIMDWTARKDYNARGDPMLHMYVETKESLDEGAFVIGLHNALVTCVEEYAAFYDMLKYNPVLLTRLTPGTFQAYLLQKQQEGADIGHFKPPRMQPQDKVFTKLLEISAKLGKVAMS